MAVDKSEEGRIRQALGAGEAIPLASAPSQGPLDLLQLRAELGGRLQSSGGRPSDPEWSIRRLVPFKKNAWEKLELLAEQCRSTGQSVSPSQLAALLIERGLQRLTESKA